MLPIDWTPNPKDRMPLYVQIIEFIRNKIRLGDWPVNSKLPPQRELARIFQVNRSTLATALDELIADGLLESKIGSSIWVANNTWSVLTSPPQVNWHSYAESGIYLPNFPTIQQINLEEFNLKNVRLGTGELSPELIPAELLKGVVSKVPDKIQSFGYEEPRGLLYLRQQLSHYLRDFGIIAAPESILIVSGALQALQLICFGLLPKDATILLEKPSYLLSLKLFQSLSMQFSGIPLDDEGIQVTSITNHKKCQKASLLYTIPCFHNPTGTLMTNQRRQDLIVLSQNELLPIIEDDVYRELWIDAPPPAPLKARDTDGRVIYIGSLSKSVSPGLRIGWIVGPEPVIERLADIKMQNDYGSSSLSQWAAAEWLASGLNEQHLHQIRKQLKIRRDTAIEALEKHFAGIATWTIPKGGFYIWLTLTQPVSMHKLFKAALDTGLLINPGNIYDPLSNQHLRLSYSYAALPDLKKGLYRLAGIIRQLNR
ncbi:PLP-dependent aminotransferase family protein [Sporomusa aerivorans]|uniref:aminotransferase-like domain-containing protein n=1 Tax=Sporomusa aerivorans TaxID=204936 RepID=UPI00352A5626